MQAYSCKDIQIELAKARQLQAFVKSERKDDLREIAGFLGDFGIGNAMERRDAVKSADRRIEQLTSLWSYKRCGSEGVRTP